MKKSILLLFLFTTLYAQNTPYTASFLVSPLYNSGKPEPLKFSLQNSYGRDLVLQGDKKVVDRYLKHDLMIDSSFKSIRFGADISCLSYVKSDKFIEEKPEKGIADSLLFLSFMPIVKNDLAIELGTIGSLPSGKPENFSGEGTSRLGFFGRSYINWIVNFDFMAGFLGRKSFSKNDENYSHEIVSFLKISKEINSIADISAGYVLSTEAKNLFTKNHTSLKIIPATSIKIREELSAGIQGGFGIGKAPFTPAWETTLYFSLKLK